MRFVLVCLLLITSFGSFGCALPSYDDERSFGTIVDDTALAANIKGRLLSSKFTDGYSVKVYSYDGKVFLVGNVPNEFQTEAEHLARSTQGAQSVTPHWFTGPSSTLADKDLEVKVAANLITTPGVSSTQVELEVHNGEVIVLGMVNNPFAAERVLEAVRKTEGVKKITSYLLIKDPMI